MLAVRQFRLQIATFRGFDREGSEIMYKNSISAILVVALVFGSSANAADNFESTPATYDSYSVVEQSPFAGLYVGLEFGSGIDGGFKSEDWNAQGDGWNGFREKRDLNPHFTGGGHIGYNWVPEFGNEKFLLGAQIAAVIGGLRGASHDSWENIYFTEKGGKEDEDFGLVKASSRVKESTEVNWGGDATIKFGFMPTRNLLLYGKGGFALAHVSTGYRSHYTSEFTSDIDGHVEVDLNEYRNSDDGFAAGFVVGGGIEYFPGFLPEGISIGAGITYRELTLMTSSHSEEGSDGTFRGHSDESLTGFEAMAQIKYYF